MILKIVPRVGDRPLVLDATQFVVYQDNGTPIAVAAEYGPEGAQAVSMVGQPDFERLLRLLGVHTTVVVDTVPSAAPLKGAKLLGRPDPH